MTASEGLAWCSVCHGEFGVTKAGRVKTHQSASHGQPVRPPKCPGSLKNFELGMEVECHDCGGRTRKASTRALYKHRDPQGGICMAPSQEYRLIVEGLGAVQVGQPGGESSGSMSSMSDSSPSSAGSSTTPTVVSSSGSAALTVKGSSSSMLNPERPTETLEEKSQRLTEAPVPPRSSPSTKYPAPPTEMTSVEAPPSSSAMFGEAGATVRAKPRKRVPLEGEALALSNWFDDLFFRYQHSRERSMQPTIGPSEVGSQCMRKIAMKLSQRPEVNFEKDTYAAWFGTQGHLGLEEMLRWANQTMHVERFLIEAALEFGSEAMPHGHSDAFDRRPDAVGFDRLQGIVIDWKFPGTSALSKMHLDGISLEYETQGHLYGYGQRLAGENVERVAVIALPRQTGDLSGKFVWVAPYDEGIAIKAIKKAEAIKKRLDEYTAAGQPEPWKMAPKTPSYLCPYCPFHLANDTAETKGCNGQA